VVSALEPLRGAKLEGAPQAAAEVWAPLPDAHVDAVLSEACAAVRLREVPVSAHAVAQDPAEALLEVAEEVGAALIVVGHEGMHGAQRLVPSNVPGEVSHRARCNVLIVSTDQP
jgi:nucleotide-binding universal stress UspA family protein